MSNGITYEKGKIQIDADYLAASMSNEDYHSFIKGVALDSFIIDKVVDYICDEDEDGFWTSGSNRTREEILMRIEKSQMSANVRFNWSFLKNIEDKLKKIAVNKSMYYKIYHCGFLDQRTKDALLDHEECEYKTDKANDQINALHKMVKEAMDSLKC